MKLLARTSLYYLVLSVPILILSGFICFYIITKEVRGSNDELLLNRNALIENYLKENDTIYLKIIAKSREATIKKIATMPAFKIRRATFSDTLIFDKKENELAENRLLSSVFKVGNTNYSIKIWRSTLEYNELFRGIFTSLVILLILLFITYLIINFWISKTVWKPFYQTVSNLKKFRASDNVIPRFANTSVTEFDELNLSLNVMMQKMIVDFNSQKKFTENASHEIQTPLAVIKSKIDLLIQSENLKENDVKLISAIDDACSKIIRLNKSFLLLTKIENRQFNITEKVSFQNTVDSSLVFFEEHIQASSIAIIKNIESDFCVVMNVDLCLVLVNNLLQNAIRHNISSGNIDIFIQENKITISNLGDDKPIDSVLFERFHKNTTSQESLGLGLSIVKEIAAISGLVFNYKYTGGKHCFILTRDTDFELK
ncbi:histidine kinase dimerization/phospho-acceptor domain-containing protein [Flavobacterium sp. ZS1P14]|uniref:PorY family sensor histidine kinase n=1 Tax=Flavobacterium sp. ZS1P14 TaxID=3401729 RepID=UPI003AAEF61E